MSRIGFSRTQILILVSVWLTFLISFVMAPILGVIDADCQ